MCASLLFIMALPSFNSVELRRLILQVLLSVSWQFLHEVMAFYYFRITICNKRQRHRHAYSSIMTVSLLPNCLKTSTIKISTS